MEDVLKETSSNQDMTAAWTTQINLILDQIRPSLEAHGGDAKLIGIEGKKVVLELHGACHGCPMASMTFGVMVDDLIKEQIPEIEEVVYE